MFDVSPLLLPLPSPYCLQSPSLVSLAPFLSSWPSAGKAEAGGEGGGEDDDAGGWHYEREGFAVYT